MKNLSEQICKCKQIIIKNGIVSGKDCNCDDTTIMNIYVRHTPTPNINKTATQLTSDLNQYIQIEGREAYITNAGQRFIERTLQEVFK